MLHEMPNLIVIIAILNTGKLLMHSDDQFVSFFLNYLSSQELALWFHQPMSGSQSINQNNNTF